MHCGYLLKQAFTSMTVQPLLAFVMMVVFRSGVKLMEGRGKVLDPHTVEVDGKKFTVGLARWMVWPCLPARPSSKLLELQ